MNVSGERTTSIWGSADVSAEPLNADMQADVIVIGSGIAGMSVAYELAIAGQSVVVIDRGPIAGGMTARTTAHLSAYCDDGFRELIRMRGLETAKRWYESQSASISRIESITGMLRADCDFRRVDGYLFLSPETEHDILEAEFIACGQVGMPTLKQKGVPFTGQEATPALRFPAQATFHPMKYLSALATAIRAAGGRFIANTPVVQVEENEAGVRVRTMGGHSIGASHAVVATNAPINDRFAIHTKQAPYRTYAAAFEAPHGALPDALYWDTLDPYHYVRLQPGEEFDVVIVGGEDHKTGESDDGDERILSLSAWMRNLLPGLGREVARWSGQVLEPIDYVGFIGLNPNETRVFVATGDSGQGMTHGVVAGMLISDLILRGKSPWQETYDPARKPMMATAEFLKENLTAVKSIAEHLLPGEVASYDDLQPGKGGIVNDGLQKIAAYRDEGGTLMACSAACTHLGCQLRWNSFERCWDCPCHGSQFAPSGEALNAPSVEPLKAFSP